MRACWMRVCWSHALALAIAALVGTSWGSAHAQTAAGGFQWQTLGERTYSNNCTGCHQASGNGIPGGFPPLANHTPDIFAQKGAAYMVRVLLFGLTGAIEVSGTKYDGSMPSWDQLKDDEIAAVLDHVLTAWGNAAHLPKDFKPIVPADVAAARAEQLTKDQVYALREQGAANAPKPAAKTAQTPPVFTDDQAERGHQAYAHNCLDCHGSNLDNGEFGGPPLKGLSFARHWEAGNVAALYSFMKAKMPPDRPGQLNDDTYADMLAYILSENGYAAGAKELPPDADVMAAMSLKK